MFAKTRCTIGAVNNVSKLLSALAAWFQRTFHLSVGSAVLHAVVFLSNRAQGAAPA